MDSVNSENNLLEMVDDGLKTYPLVPPPLNLYANVMREVKTRTVPTAVTADRFNIISWVDIAVSLFFAAMMGLCLTVEWLIPPEMFPAIGWLLKFLSLPIIALPLILGSLMGFMGLAIAAKLFFTTRTYTYRFR